MSVPHSPTTNLAYDYEGRVTSITYPNSSTNTNTYNGLDTRVGMTDSAGSKTFKRNGIGVTSPVLSDGLANYTPGLSERRSGSSTFYHGGIKNSDAQSSNGATLTASKQYDAFGNLCSSSGTWQGPFGYGGGFGYQTDADSGLKLLGHRYYDSSSGRFLSRDPIAAGRNWYSYCGGNPTSLCDPAGLFVVIFGGHQVAASGFHAYLIIKDNIKGSPTYGKRWAFSAGPENFGIGSVFAPGILMDYSGEFKPGQLDYADQSLLQWHVSERNNRPVGPVLKKLNAERAKMAKKRVSYRLGGPNSNSFFHHMVRTLGTSYWQDAKKNFWQWYPGMWDDPWNPAWDGNPASDGY